MALRAMSSCFLNTYRHIDSTAFLGCPCQCFTTLSTKKILLMSNLNIPSSLSHSSYALISRSKISSYIKKINIIYKIHFLITCLTLNHSQLLFHLFLTPLISTLPTPLLLPVSHFSLLAKCCFIRNDYSLLSSRRSNSSCREVWLPLSNSVNILAPFPKQTT